jgi:hypothetical protein
MTLAGADASGSAEKTASKRHLGHWIDSGKQLGALQLGIWNTTHSWAVGKLGQSGKLRFWM